MRFGWWRRVLPSRSGCLLVRSSSATFRLTAVLPIATHLCAHCSTVSILAVDFIVFPRRNVKSETFGTRLVAPYR